MATVSVPASFSGERFTTAAYYTMAGGLVSWTSKNNSLSNNMTYAQVSWSPTGTYGTGISNAVELTRDFVTDLSIPVGATIVRVMPTVWAGGPYWGNTTLHMSIDGTETAQVSLNFTSTGTTNRYMWPGSGYVVADWGMTSAAALLFLDGTNPLRYWAETDDDTKSTFGLFSDAYIEVHYTTEEALPTQEGAFVIGAVH